MYKKFFFILFIFVLFTVSVSMADSWDDFSTVDRMWDGQKSITNQEFEQVMEKLEEKKEQKEEKQKKKRFKKLFGVGTTLHSELNPDNDVHELQNIENKEEGILVNIPVRIIVNGAPLEQGYYKIIAERDDKNKKLYVNLYQSQFFKGKIEVNETTDDFGEEKLDFARILPYNESFVKMIFGSIDFNAYVYIPYVE